MRLGFARFITRLIVLFLLSFIGGLSFMWGLDYLGVSRSFWSCYGAFFSFTISADVARGYFEASDEIAIMDGVKR
jgi:hypothetical protein